MRITFIAFMLTVPVIFGFIAKHDQIRIHASNHQEDDTVYVQYIDTFLVGDINGDLISDTAFQFSPFFINPNDTVFNGTRNWDCDAIIRFSCGIDSILSENNLWGEVYALPDLNKDGHAEILVRPTWFIGCRGRLLVYTFNGKTWKIAGNVSFFDCQDEDYVYTDHVSTSKGKSYLLGEEVKDDKEGYPSKVKRRLKF